MNPFSFLVPRDIFRTTSSFNHDIRVQVFMGKRNLMVDGSQQSGPYIKTLWQACFRAFGIGRTRNARNILVLGVGGGTALHLLHGIFPEARIEAVDIDAKIIAISRKYFSLGTIKNLVIKKADARTFIQNTRPRKMYGIVVIDIYSGAHVPEFVASLSFMKQVQSVVAPGGSIIINYLREKEYKEKSDTLAAMLAKHFRVEEFSIFRNRFFLVE